MGARKLTARQAAQNAVFAAAQRRFLEIHDEPVPQDWIPRWRNEWLRVQVLSDNYISPATTITSPHP